MTDRNLWTDLFQDAFSPGPDSPEEASQSANYSASIGAAIEADTKSVWGAAVNSQNAYFDGIAALAGEGPGGEAQNAVAHAALSAHLALEFGQSTAEFLGDMKEMVGSQANTLDSVKDQLNNAVGREIGDAIEKLGGDAEMIPGKVAEAFSSGQLYIQVGDTLVPSGQTQAAVATIETTVKSTADAAEPADLSGEAPEIGIGPEPGDFDGTPDGCGADATGDIGGDLDVSGGGHGGEGGGAAVGSEGGGGDGGEGCGAEVSAEGGGGGGGGGDDYNDSIANDSIAFDPLLESGPAESGIAGDLMGGDPMGGDHGNGSDTHYDGETYDPNDDGLP